jgi:hypothetical protein
MVGQLEDIDKLLFAQFACDRVAVSLKDDVKGLQRHLYVQVTKIVLKLRRNNLAIFRNLFEY